MAAAAAGAFFGVLDLFGLGNVIEAGGRIVLADRFDRMALDRALANLMRAQRDLTVDVLGFGAVLIRMDVFSRLDRPWFDTPYNGQTHLGEDVYFCQQANKADMTIWVDHDLSQHVRHHSLIEYGVDSVEVESVA